MATTGLVIAPLTAATWPAMDRLFSAPGGPKFCWCMIWRAQGAGRKATDGAGRKAALHARALAGVPLGLLAWLDGAPVGWCSIAPRPSYRNLGGPHDDADPGAIWSLACFFILRAHRGKGLSRELLAAAIGHARTQGARVIEAYPVAPDAPSYRFMGFVPLFEAAGFHEVARAGNRRHVMRLVF